MWKFEEFKDSGKYVIIKWFFYNSNNLCCFAIEFFYPLFYKAGCQAPEQICLKEDV